MNKLGTIKFSGTSGSRYEFAAYPLETVFDEAFSGQAGVQPRNDGRIDLPEGNQEKAQTENAEKQDEESRLGLIPDLAENHDSNSSIRRI